MTDAPAGVLPARAVFFGSGAFAVPVLDALRAAPEIDLVGVVGAPDRPAGRSAVPTPSPLTAHARALGLSLLQPDRIRDAAAIAAVAELEPVVGVLADYGQIVPAPLLDLPRRGILNLHPSLLPRHRGATPIPATILAGDTETGVTLFRMDVGLDSGPIVATARWPLDGTETAPEIEARAAAVAADLLARTIGPWLRGEITATPQADVGVTVTRTLRRGDGRLDPDRDAVRLERQVRALQPWPGSFLETRAGRLIVWRASVVSGDPIGPSPAAAASAPRPGRFGPGPDLLVATADGWLRLDEVQPAGGRRMPGAQYLRGRAGMPGTVAGRAG